MNIDDRLLRAFGRFKLWTLAEGRQTTFKKFTRQNFHYTAGKFPYIGGKGSDSQVVLQFLSFYLRLCVQQGLLHQDHGRLFSSMLQCVEGLLTFLGVCQSHDMWMPKSCATFAYLTGLRSLRAYSVLARHSMGINRRLFCMRSKFHSMAEIVFSMRKCVEANHPWVLNPNCFCCEANEDFIGRISRISRKVSAKLCALRTMQRYGLAFKSRLKKACAAKRQR